MAEILVGTCSWTEPTLIEEGNFYPDWARSAQDRLGYYASQFPLVEVDSTYYSLPAERTSRLWAGRTPEGFIFDVKAFRLFTLHPTPNSSLPKDIRGALTPELREKPKLYLKDMPPELTGELWRRFERALLPLDSTAKLGVVLFQFPPWFLPTKKAREHILSCREALPQYRMAVEFRNGTWLGEDHKEETLGFLKDNGLIFVAVDEPQGFKSSVPPVAEATADIAAVRLHGRNRDTWEREGISSAERFNYLYCQEELQEWLPRIEGLASKARQVHVLFNNCYKDKATTNARQFTLMLGERDMPLRRPPSLIA